MPHLDDHVSLETEIVDQEDSTSTFDINDTVVQVDPAQGCVMVVSYIDADIDASGIADTTVEVENDGMDLDLVGAWSYFSFSGDVGVRGSQDIRKSQADSSIRELFRFGSDNAAYSENRDSDSAMLPSGVGYHIPQHDEFYFKQAATDSGGSVSGVKFQIAAILVPSEMSSSMI